MSCTPIIINENSSGFITWTFRDDERNLAVPNSVEYRIDNKEDDAEILAPTSVTPASVIRIMITNDQNIILDQTLEYEEHVITVTANYGVGDSISEQCVFKVKNLQFVGYPN